MGEKPQFPSPESETIFFTPGGGIQGEFKRLAARINSGSGQMLAFPAGTYMQDVNFSSSDLQGMDFSESNLTRADFSGCNLRGASFRDAVMRQVTPICDVSGADFTDADFSDVFAQGTNFEGSIFTDANLKGVNFYGGENNEPGPARGLAAGQLSRASVLKGIVVRKDLEVELQQLVPEKLSSNDRDDL